MAWLTVSDGQDNSEDGLHDTYKFKDKNLRVKLDLITGVLELDAKKLNLSPLDNSNGVNVELYLDGSPAVENIPMTELPGRQLDYDSLAP